MLMRILRLAIDDQSAAAFLANLGQDEVQFLAVLLEYGRAQLDLGAFRQTRRNAYAARSGGDQILLNTLTAFPPRIILISPSL